MRRESWMLPRAVNMGRKVELKFADKRTLQQIVEGKDLIGS